MTPIFVVTDEAHVAITARDTKGAALQSARRLARAKPGRTVVVWLTDERPRCGAMLTAPLGLVRIFRRRSSGR